jgi:diamine N-acetyltransferase
MNFEGVKEKNEENINWAFQKIINSKNSYIFLIEYSKNIVGMCTLHTLISSVEGGVSGLIEDFYIDEKYRKLGLGQSLVKKVEEFCKKKNYKRIQLLCRPNNINAINFYEKIGFKGKDMVFFYKHL